MEASQLCRADHKCCEAKNDLITTKNDELLGQAEDNLESDLNE